MRKNVTRKGILDLAPKLAFDVSFSWATGCLIYTLPSSYRVSISHRNRHLDPRVNMLGSWGLGVILYSRATIWPGRRAGILRRGARRPLRPRVSSCFVLAAVLVSAKIASVGSVSMRVVSSSGAVSSWLDWAAGVSVTLRRGSNGDLLIAGCNGDFVVVFGCTCNRLRLRNLFRGFGVVARAVGLVSAGAWRTEKTISRII